MTKTEKRIEFFRRYCLFYLMAHMEGIKILPTSFQRTRVEQNRLYHDGKSIMDGYKKRSLHQDSMAFDGLVLEEDGSLCGDGADARYKRLAEIAKAVGLKTGFDWHKKDSGHTQWMEGV